MTANDTVTIRSADNGFIVCRWVGFAVREVVCKTFDEAVIAIAESSTISCRGQGERDPFVGAVARGPISQRCRTVRDVVLKLDVAAALADDLDNYDDIDDDDDGLIEPDDLDGDRLAGDDDA